MTATLGNTRGRRCRICGCTDKEPCVADGGLCSWSPRDEGLCDFCDVAVLDLAPWLALQAHNHRTGASARALLAEAVAMAHALIDADEEAAPRVVVVDEAEASAFLRAKGAGV
jgi:hypothetical protein